MSATISTFKKGAVVRPSGTGRTRTWPRDLTGTVTRRRGGSVFVHWTGTSFEDEMALSEVLNACSEASR